MSSARNSANARFAVAHGKSDRFDAFVLCELARTDAHRSLAILRGRARQLRSLADESFQHIAQVQRGRDLV